MDIVQRIKNKYVDVNVDFIDIKCKNISFRACIEALRDSKIISIDDYYQLIDFIDEENQNILKNTNFEALL